MKNDAIWHSVSCVCRACLIQDYNRIGGMRRIAGDRPLFENEEEGE